MEKKVYYIFKCQKDKEFFYVELDDLAKNNGKSYKEQGLPTFSFKYKLGVGSNGAIFEVTEKETGGVSYKPKQLPTGWWKNEDDRSAWRAVQAAEDTKKKLIAEGAKNMLEKRLEPINFEWRRADHHQKRLILAEVIRLITK